MSFSIPNFDFSVLGRKEDVKAAKAALAEVTEIAAAIHMGYDTPEIVRPATIPEALVLLDQHNLLVAPNGAPLNEQQRIFVAHVVCGISCCLIGAAGTGKTTAVQASMKALIALGLTGTIPKGSLKHISEDAPSIVACAFTNRAARNIATKLPDNMRENALTHHKLCEYVPVDKNSNESKRFVPSRTHRNPLPELDVIYYEEASMLDYELYAIQEAAYNPALRPTEIVLGDMFQLPPIFGMSLLAKKLTELPVIELTEVYRQAMESPIIRLAHAIKDGVAIPPFKRDKYVVPGELDIQYFPKGDIEPTHLAMQMGANMFKRMMQGEFKPSTDTVLIPNNKNFGQITINRAFYAELDKQYPEGCDPEKLDELAPILWGDFPEMMERIRARQFRGFRPYKIQAGHNFHYFSEGDRVIYGSREAVILEIIRNTKFKKPVMVGAYTRWGKALDDLDEAGGDVNLMFDDSPAHLDEDIDLDELAAKFEDIEDAKEKAENQASYILVLQLDDGFIVKVETRGDMNTMSGAIATTVHKSQGLEFRRVYLLLHKACGRMQNNEIVYTGVTRARESLCILCQQDSLSVAAGRRQIKGATLQEKVEWIHEELKKQAASGRYRDSEG